MKNWKNVKSELLRDVELRKEYDNLAPYFELATQLMDARIKKGLTQGQLADRVGTKQSAIARLESGKYNPSLHLLEKVADATDSILEIRIKS